MNSWPNTGGAVVVVVVTAIARGGLDEATEAGAGNVEVAATMVDGGAEVALTARETGST